jgi:uncharacterized membrane protein YqaE (UPF0057 family)
MKRTLLLLAFAFCFVSSYAVNSTNWANHFSGEPEIAALPADMAQFNLNQFLTLTPNTYTEITGKKLGFVKTVQLKAAQKYLKKKVGQSEDISKEIYIVLAIFGLGFVAMGLLDDWKGSDWIINLVLTALCWLPGLIHAFMKMKKYYP